MIDTCWLNTNSPNDGVQQVLTFVSALHDNSNGQFNRLTLLLVNRTLEDEKVIVVKTSMKDIDDSG